MAAGQVEILAYDRPGARGEAGCEVVLLHGSGHVHELEQPFGISWQL